MTCAALKVAHKNIVDAQEWRFLLGFLQRSLHHITLERWRKQLDEVVGKAA